MSLVRIAITGPESTGKSMLSEALAGHFRSSWVPEYAREYIGNLKRPYGKEDILAIAKGQLEREKQANGTGGKLLFCDTELIVTKIWSEVKYGSCDPWILEKIAEHRYDLYLLCDIDLPWEYDPQREHPHMRQYLFDLYRAELTERKLPFEVINGLGDTRLKNAIEALRIHFNLSFS
jgi:NadR type nicotinamide-nucleotide adenylyltransferase